MQNYDKDGSIYHSCFDRLIFSQIAAIVGGKVRMMLTASAPIDPKVIRFIKVVFSCPMIEGYGLSEVSGGASTTYPNDSITGHVGGPLPCFKFRLKDLPEMNYLSSD